jgi:hypothetical protein
MHVNPKRHRINKKQGIIARPINAPIAPSFRTSNISLLSLYTISFKISSVAFLTLFNPTYEICLETLSFKFSNLSLISKDYVEFEVLLTNGVKFRF